MPNYNFPIRFRGEICAGQTQKVRKTHLFSVRRRESNKIPNGTSWTQAKFQSFSSLSRGNIRGTNSKKEKTLSNFKAKEGGGVQLSNKLNPSKSTSTCRIGPTQKMRRSYQFSAGEREVEVQGLRKFKTPKKNIQIYMPNFKLLMLD